jgi:glutamate formiminotransferase/formiminotetrahydrofolate cyclodeaminase
MIEIGNPNSVTDAGVGALAIRTAVLGACYNVRINAGGITDKAFTEKLLLACTELEQQTDQKDTELRSMVLEKIK